MIYIAQSGAIAALIYAYIQTHDSQFFYFIGIAVACLFMLPFFLSRS